MSAINTLGELRMKLFTKIALVSAMALSANAMAAQLQALDDDALSAATGQDGLTIQIDTDVNGITIEHLYLHDNDGLDSTLTFTDTDGTTKSLGGTGGSGTLTSGAITISGLEITKANASDILTTVRIDADKGDGTSNGGNSAFLNIGVDLAATDIHIDSIGVAESNAAPTMGAATTARRGVNAANSNDIITNLDIAMGATALNIQLGAQPQGALIVVNADILGGINISNLTLSDTGANGGGDIVVGSTWIKDANSANLSANAKINVTTDGLKIHSTGTAKDIYVDSLALGNGKSIGSVEIQGLNMNSTTMTIAGH